MKKNECDVIEWMETKESVREKKTAKRPCAGVYKRTSGERSIV